MTAVFDDLNSKLMRATKQLQNVLTTGTEVCFNKHLPLSFTLFFFFFGLFKHLQLLII